ncbi:MAG TPA: phosphatase PAP2 family protein, partial [Thiotrichales bacterium]|nr:phosphatase PAP2 family protein [Thiotrichales bacterium]
MNKPYYLFLLLLLGTSAFSVEEIKPGILKGYLSEEEKVNSLTLVAPVAEKGSALYALDRAVSKKSLALRDTLRWQMAKADAELYFPGAAQVFSCALGMAVTEKDTPHLYLLLRRSMADAGYSTYKAKNHYQRARPFMVNHKPVCTPEEEAMLRGDGSYPSGHSAIGWAWALILSEVAPEKADAILYRGRAYSQSRVVCNVHWQSDINEGRMMGAAIVPLLH